MNSKGEQLTPFKYNSQSSKFYYYPNRPHVFNEGMAAVQFEGKYGFIDRNGDEAIPFEYSSTYGFQDGLAFVTNSYGGGFIDKEGDVVVPLKYWEAKRFSHGMAAVKLKDKWGFVDAKGKEVIPVRFDYLGIFRDSSAPFERIKD